MILSQQAMDTVSRSFWKERSRQHASSQGANGSSTETTGGKHLHKLLGHLEDLLLDAGMEEVALEKKVPGYYSPAKNWDVVGINRDLRQMIVIEARSQAGASIGNNYNNRVQEMLGSATEVRKAQADGALRGWQIGIGGFFLLEDSPSTREAGRIRSVGKSWTHDPEAEWLDIPYADRYRESLERLQRGPLDAAALVLTCRDDHSWQPGSQLLAPQSFEQSVRNLLASWD